MGIASTLMVPYVIAFVCLAKLGKTLEGHTNE
jgi:hypothetical protein